MVLSSSCWSLAYRLNISPLRIWMLYRLPTTMAVASATAPIETASPTFRVREGMGA